MQHLRGGLRSRWQLCPRVQKVRMRSRGQVTLNGKLNHLIMKIHSRVVFKCVFYAAFSESVFKDARMALAPSWRRLTRSQFPARQEVETTCIHVCSSSFLFNFTPVFFLLPPAAPSSSCLPKRLDIIPMHY